MSMEFDVESDGIYSMEEPIICGGQLDGEHIFGMLAAEDAPETILKGFPRLELEDIQACLVYARRMVSQERAGPLLVGTGA